MLIRLILGLTLLLTCYGSIQSQPWSGKDEVAEKILDSLLNNGAEAGALKKTIDPKTKAIRWLIVDETKLAGCLTSENATITDAVCDGVVNRWRSEVGNRPFWTAFLGAVGTATKRSRDQGFSELFQGVAASGDAKTGDKAKNFYLRARDNFRAAKDTAWVAAAETEIGNLAFAKEQFAEADAAYSRAVALYAKARGPKNPLVASIIRNQGNVAFRQQKHSDAIRFYQEAIDMLGADNGPNAMDIADCLQNLANAFIANQDAPAAKQALNRGLAIIQKAEGEMSARQLPFFDVLGRIYQSRHENALAREVASKSLKIAREVFGEKSIAIVRYINDLANRELAVGNGKVAIRLHQDALAILQQQPVPNETEIAEIRASLGEDLEAIAKPDEAEKEYQQALDGYRKGSTRRDRVGEIFTLKSLGALASTQGKIAQSKSHYRDAITTASKTLGPTHPFLSLLKQSLGFELLRDGAYADGAEEFRSARKLIAKAEKQIEWADLTSNLAMALEMSGEIAEAKREVNEAILIFRREQHPHLASAYTTLASIHRKQGDYEEAARMHGLAMEIQKKALGPEHNLTMRLRSMVAMDERNAGNFAAAEKSFQDLADIEKKKHGPEHPEYVNVLMELAAVRAESGKLSDAIATLENIMRIQRDSKTFPLRQRVTTLTELARMFERKRNLDQAVEYLKKARKLLIDSGLTDSLMHADVLFQLGKLAETQGDPKSAQVNYSEAMQVFRALKAVAQSSGLLTIKQMASLKRRAGDFPGALQWIEEGLAALAVNPPNNGFPWKLSPDSVDLLTLKAEILLLADHKSVAGNKAAYQLLLTAGQITDRLRFEERSSVEAKASLLGNVQNETILLRLTVCEMLAQADLDGGWLNAAFRAAEEGRARVFLEQLGRGRSNLTGDLPPQLANQELKNLQDLERLRRELESVEGSPFDQRDPTRVVALEKSINEATRTYEEIQTLIARDHPRVAALRRPYPCSVDEARSVLAKNEAAVLFICGNKVSYALVLQPPEVVGNGITMIPLPGMEEFEDDLEVLLSESNLKVADLYRDKAAKIYRLLISPLEDSLRGRDLVIIPDGKLGLLAFETLIDTKGRFLIESRAVRMGPSMTALHLNRLWDPKRPRPTRSILAIGDPITSLTDGRQTHQSLGSEGRRLAQRTGERFDRLVHSGHEAIAVADVFRAPAEDRWLGLDASESRLKSWNGTGRLAQYRYLHFATHGILGAGKEISPALVLSLTTPQDPNTDDGFLTVSEVSRLRLNADLVVLSACRSARGELRTGEGVTGLARGFLNAGTRGVICSLWTVDDQDTSTTMAEIYQQLEREVPAATALRAAKLRLIREGKHPFDWAPFILIGASK